MAKEKKDVLKEDDEEQVEYVPVEEEPDNDRDDDSDDSDDEDDDEDHPKVVSEEEDEEGDEDEREKIRERRRQEKKERAERRKLAMQRDRTELDFLRKRNDDLERRLTGIETKSSQSELSSIQQQLQATIRDIETTEKIIAKAIEAGDGEDVTKAMKYRDAAIRKAQQLDYIVKQRSQKKPQQAPQQQQPDPVALNNAKAFISEHPWYNPQQPDEDTAIVMAIDQALTREGKDPRSDEYWSELRKRVKRRLPERFESQKSERKTRGGPSLGSGKEHAPSSTKKEVYISPERKAALVEAGVWDDPVLRQRYIKRYMEYDRQAGKA